jgi:hypothetical protein
MRGTSLTNDIALIESNVLTVIKLENDGAFSDDAVV